MALSILLVLASVYRPAHWQHYPSMDEVRCISTSPNQVYVAVPAGVYVFDRFDYAYVRALTPARGLAADEDVRLCAHNPARSELLIATRSHLYQYLTATDVLNELFPPFKQIKSIGISSDGAYFDTDAGLFRKQRAAPQFDPVGSLPRTITWYGERDTLEPTDYTFLVPYYIMDDQLINHRMKLVRAEPRFNRLYVAVENYGIQVYNSRTGFPEKHIRLGPTQGNLSRIISFDNRIWLLSDRAAVALDTAGTWSYRRTIAGDLPASGARLLFGNVLELRRREGLNAAVGDSLAAYFATDRGIYLLDSEARLTNVFKLNQPVHGLARVKDTILFGTDVGLFALAGESLRTIIDPFERASHGVYSIAGSPAGPTWFGVLGGMLSLDRAGNWQHLIPPGFDLSLPVRTIAAAESLLFFADGSRVTAYNQSDGSFTHFDAKDGLPAAGPTALFADDRYLWIAAPGILTQLDYRAELGP